jgi:sigma-70-like protein
MTPDRIEEFESLQPRLFAIAYRMLGRVSDAEDIVQETYVRYQRALRRGTDIESTPGVSVCDRYAALDQRVAVGTCARCSPGWVARWSSTH